MPEPAVLRSDRRPVTGAELRGGLQALGLPRGATVMVHASLSAFGWIVGGSETVVRALLACLGETGTVCAQVSWEDIPFGIDEWPGTWREAYESDPPVFDPTVAEAGHFEGRLAERIRTWPGAWRSANADTGVAAVGARATWLVHPHDADDGFGPDSPYARLVEADGQVLLLGAPLHSISLLHHAEALASVPRKRRVRYRVPERRDGCVAWRTCEDIDVRRGPVPYERVVPCGSPPLGAIAGAALRAGVGRWADIWRRSLPPVPRGPARRLRPVLDRGALRGVNGLAEVLDAAVPEILRFTGTPGISIAVADRRGDVLARAYGRHDIAADRPMTPGSIFPAGSMTKLYTAVAVLQLVERGVIGLHDPVERHLGGIRCVNPLGDREVTVRDLLTFRSGLAVDTTGSSMAPPPSLVEHVATELASAHGREYAGTAPRWAAPVGSAYHYANLGISMLGLIVETRNPERLDLPTYLDAHVIGPLGMRSTWLSRWEDASPHPDRAAGYACFAGHAVPTPEIRSADFPANGLHTVPSDHLRLLCALRRGGGPVLRPETVRLMLTPQVRMGPDAALSIDADWWTGLVAIISRLGREDVHFGQPGAHSWGWWSVSRAYPRLGCAVVACANGWDMMRWHNPANRDAAALVVDLVAGWFADPAEHAQRSWAEKRAYLAGVILGERTVGSLGVSEPFDGAWDEPFEAGVHRARSERPDGAWSADLLRAPGGGISPAELPALLADLGAVYGFPAPLWFWGQEASAATSVAATIA